MMHRLTAAALVLHAGLLFAAPAPEEILRDLEAKRQAVGPVSMPFVHTRYSSLFTEPQARTGRFHFDGASFIVMQYETPEAYAFCIEQDRGWVLRPAQPEQRMDLRQSPMLAGMVRMMKFNMTELGRTFEVAVTQDGPDDQITLTPRRPAGITALTMHVDRATGLLKELIIDETAGDRQETVFDIGAVATPASNVFDRAYWRQYFEEHEPE